MYLPATMRSNWRRQPTILKASRRPRLLPGWVVSGHPRNLRYFMMRLLGGISPNSKTWSTSPNGSNKQGIIKMKADRDAEASKALALLLHVKGELVWFVRLSADNVLRMDFGSPHLKIREPNPHASGNSQAVIDALGRRMVTPTGKWHLFISEGEWSVTTKFYACSRSDTNAEHINATLRQLDGQRLVNVNRKNERHGWSLEFDLGAILHINSPRIIRRR